VFDIPHIFAARLRQLVLFLKTPGLANYPQDPDVKPETAECTRRSRRGAAVRIYI